MWLKSNKPVCHDNLIIIYRPFFISGEQHYNITTNFNFPYKYFLRPKHVFGLNKFVYYIGSIINPSETKIYYICG